MSRILLILFLVFGFVTAAQARPDLGWLDYAEASRASYDIDTDTGDTAHHVATPVWRSDAGAGPVKRVMLLIPKRSEVAYTLSVNTILQQFKRRGIPARFDIWYYDRDDEIAHEALAWAYAEPVDLIMSVGSVATAFLYANHTGHRIPAVTAASKDPVSLGQVTDPEAGSGTNIAYTSINVATDTLVSYLRRLVPGLDTIGVMYSKDNTSAISTQVEPLREASRRLGLNVVDITVENADSAEADLDRNMPAGLEVMRASDPSRERSVLLVTGSTPVYERIAQINGHSGRIPVVSLLPEVVREGRDSALLSIGVNLTSSVAQAAVYATDILAGRADPGILPVGKVSPPDLAINFSVAEDIDVRIPMSFFEAATFIYDPDGRLVVAFGQRVGS